MDPAIKMSAKHQAREVDLPFWMYHTDELQSAVAEYNHTLFFPGSNPLVLAA